MQTKFSVIVLGAVMSYARAEQDADSISKGAWEGYLSRGESNEAEERETQSWYSQPSWATTPTPTVTYTEELPADLPETPWEPIDTFSGPTLQERVATLEQEIANLLIRNTGQDNRMTGIDTRDDGQDSRADGVDSRIDAIDTRIDGVDGRDNAQDTRLFNVETAQQAAAVEIRAQENRISANEISILGLERQQQAQAPRVDAQGVRITGTETRLDAAEPTITSQGNEILAQGTRITNAETRLNTNEASISYLAGVQGTQGTAISQAQSDISDLEGEQTTQNTRLSNVEGRATGVENRASALEASVPAIAGRVTTLEGKVSTLQTDLSDAESDIENLEGLLPLESYYNVISSEIELAQGTLATIASVDILAGQTIEITSDVCIRKDSGNLGNDARAYIELDDGNTIRQVISAYYDAERTRDEDTLCVSLQWKDTVPADVEASVVIRGSVEKAETINVLPNQTSVSYKIWDVSYTTTTSS